MRTYGAKTSCAEVLDETGMTSPGWLITLAGGATRSTTPLCREARARVDDVDGLVGPVREV